MSDLNSEIPICLFCTFSNESFLSFKMLIDVFSMFLSTECMFQHNQDSLQGIWFHALELRGDDSNYDSVMP